MDPFTGLGSTAVACARLGVSFIGAELDEAYLDAAIERVQDAGKPGWRRRGSGRETAAEAEGRRANALEG